MLIQIRSFRALQPSWRQYVLISDYVLGRLLRAGTFRQPPPDQNKGFAMDLREAPPPLEPVGPAPTRRVMLTVGGGIGLAAFLAACGGGLPHVRTPTTGATPSPTGVGGLPYVRITTTGATFSPAVELAAGSTATVSWAVEGGATVTGTNPMIRFRTAATRHVQMSVDGDGADELDAVITLNLGFNHLDDAGTYNMGAGYDKTAQAVTLVEGISKLTGLRRFAAAHTNLTGSLDFTGCSALKFIECFGADVQSVTLTGCTSLTRLCMENNNLTNLDLNPVAANLRDLRSAVQQGGTLTLTALTSPLAALYHLCIVEQVIIGHPTAAQLPVVQERWDRNTHQSGALTSASSAFRSILTSGNHYTTADLTDQFPAGRWGTLDASSNDLTSVILAGCSGLHGIDLHANNMAATAVDAVLAMVNSWATSGGTLNVAGNTEPSTTGAAHASTLTGRGWTITTTT